MLLGKIGNLLEKEGTVTLNDLLVTALGHEAVNLQMEVMGANNSSRTSEHCC